MTCRVRPISEYRTEPATAGRCVLAGRLAALLLAGLTCATGCLAPSYPNRASTAFDPAAGYRFESLALGDGNTDDLFACLTFSGGGTRAAALAYGVLQGLRDTPINTSAGGNSNRRLLDELDMISSVSGGSFTALAYGLWRDAIFDGTYERRFLKNNIQRILLQALLNPLTLFKLMSMAVDRSDVAATYYDDEIFRHRTYADLPQRRPFVVINATNLALEQRFEFTQDDFDLLGSDLGTVPLGWSAAASSAVPILLSPLRLKYHDGSSVAMAIAHAIGVSKPAPPDRRRGIWAKKIMQPLPDGATGPCALDAANHRYLYLVDGAMVDNLGLSAVIQAYENGPIRRRLATNEAGGRPAIRRLVVIVVDAGNSLPEDMERFPASPSIFMVGYKAGMASIQNTSDALLDLLRQIVDLEPQRRAALTEQLCATMKEHCPDAAGPATCDKPLVQRYLIVVSLQDVLDAKLRRKLLRLPTNFFLGPDDVDDLIRQGHELLGANLEFQRLLHDLATDQPPAPH